MNASKRRPSTRRPTERRRGAETLEVLLALPVLLIATIAVFEFGFLMLAHQAVTTAAVEGVREAAKENSTTSSAALEVYRILNTHQLTFSTTSTNLTDDVRVVVERFGGPTEQVGNTSLVCTPNGGALQLNQVRLTVCVRVSNTSGRPVPNWLSTLGFSLTNRTFEVSALATVE